VPALYNSRRFVGANPRVCPVYFRVDTGVYPYSPLFPVSGRHTGLPLRDYVDSLPGRAGAFPSSCTGGPGLKPRAMFASSLRDGLPCPVGTFDNSPVIYRGAGLAVFPQVLQGLYSSARCNAPGGNGRECRWAGFAFSSEAPSLPSPCPLAVPEKGAFVPEGRAPGPFFPAHFC
jgi:hypothetical protein